MPMPSAPPIRWSELAGRRVGLWGVGIEGRANLRKLRSLGVEPVLVDDRPPAPHQPATVPGGGGGEIGAILATGAGGFERLRSCEVVVKSPGISRYRPEVSELTRLGVAVVGGLGLWMEEADRDGVVLVTGTKGKSTTASLIGHLARGFGRSVFVGGNLGVMPYDPELDTGGVELFVVEASSFQILDLWSAPAVVVVTAIGEDHIDWHGSRERYVTDKLSVCSLPGVRVAVANGADERLRARSTLLGTHVRWVSAEAAGLQWADALGLLGSHNRMNAALARAALVEAGVAGARVETALARAAAGFESLSSRLQPAGSIDGVEFVDDSLATNVLPTIAALDAFPRRRLALIVGGYDRGIDYRPLAEHLRRRTTPTLVLAMPDNGTRIVAAIEQRPPPESLRLAPVDGLLEAVRRGLQWSRPDGVVLLSPAAPSFGHFADYKERSAACE
jgi:UDP-N-acetylmuramoylalanine--D-glutamate ligase